MSVELERSGIMCEMHKFVKCSRNKGATTNATITEENKGMQCVLYKMFSTEIK